MSSIKINKKKGIVFWITGLSGSGKTRLGMKIKKKITKIYGPTILFSGDDIRNIFNLKKYSLNDRKKIVINYSKLSQNIYNQNINVIFCVVGLKHEVHKMNRKNIENYVEIFVKAPMNKVEKLSNKTIYKKKYIRQVVGFDIKPEYPKNPTITIVNDFSKPIEKLSEILLSKIKKIVKTK
jgi:adenylylsulfate kinase